MKRVALMGTPNAGKTALFNVLTKSNQRVANYAGVTVESAEADFYLPPHEKAVLVDLPGAYSLQPFSDEEGELLRLIKAEHFDGAIIVIDATQLERGIRFVLEVMSTTSKPVVIAVNMEDLARKQGIEFDLDQLPERKLFGAEVLLISATKKRGLKELLQAVSRLFEQPAHLQAREALSYLSEHWGHSPQVDGNQNKKILEFYKQASAICKQIRRKPGQVDEFSQKLDRWILHPVWGWLILATILFVTFQLMFNLAQIPMDWIDASFGWLGGQAQASSLPDVLKSFLADGVIAGIGGTIVFLPQILILFALILFLEDFGFMARAVMLLDHAMGRVGLHGRAFLPLLSSYACAVPGIMATRSIESKRDRTITILTIPLTTCSARLPVYTLLIGAFIPNRKIAFGIGLQGLVMFALYAVGILFALLMGALFKKFLLKGETMPLFLELPSYKWPSLESIFKGLVYRAKLFLRRVGRVIFTMTVIIWVLVSFPKDEQGKSDIEKSYAAQMGHWIEPALRPIGFDWKIGMSLIPTFAAREVMIGALATTYAVEASHSAQASHADQDEVEKKLSNMISNQWTLATGLSLLVWFIFAPMCISTIAAAKRELGSNKWLVVMVAYLFGLAYLGAWVTYRVFS